MKHKQALNSLYEMITDKMELENVISLTPYIIEWENEMGKFRYDHNKLTIYLQPIEPIEYLDLNFTILPSGIEFDTE